MNGRFKQSPGDDVFETLKSKLGIRDDGTASATSQPAQPEELLLAVAADKRSGNLVVRFGDRSYTLTKKKALALAEKIKKKSSELT